MPVITRLAVQYFDDARGIVEAFTAASGHAPDLREWSIINMLIGEMILLRNGNAAPHFRERIRAFIAGAVEGEEVFALLAAIADRKIQANDLQG